MNYIIILINSLRISCSDYVAKSLSRVFPNCALNGGGGIRTHEPLRDGITYFDLESCAFDQASLPLLDNSRLSPLISGLRCSFVIISRSDTNY